MKTKTINLYSFDELNEEAKKIAIKHFENINFSFGDWWDTTFEDAKEISCKIKNFSIDHHHIDFEFISSGQETANSIIVNHGKECETHKLALKFLADWNEMFSRFKDPQKPDRIAEENDQAFDVEADELENKFCNAIGNEYLALLLKDWEYRQTDEAIIEAIKSNEYDFLESGKFAGDI